MYRFHPISEKLFKQIKELTEGTTKDNGICRLCKEEDKVECKLKESDKFQCQECLKKGSEKEKMNLWICMVKLQEHSYCTDCIEKVKFRLQNFKALEGVLNGKYENAIMQ